MFDHLKKHILIVDDDDILPVFLQKYLTQHHYKVTYIANGEEIAAVLDHCTIDAIVLDIILPGKNGFYWLDWLNHNYPHIPVLMASVKTNENDRLQGLEGGAKDYVVKPFHYKELLLRLANVLHKTPASTTSSHMIYLGDLRFDISTNKIYSGDAIARLTQMEAQILQLLHQHAGIALSRDEIMQTTRGIKYHPLDRSIDIHINKIRKKIEKNPLQPTLIRTIRGKGYMLQLPDQPPQSKPIPNIDDS